jgi:carbamoyltransferase
MGLAPYGEARYTDLIMDNLIDIKEDGTFRLNMQYFNYCTGLTMTNSRFDRLFEGPPRKPESAITQKEMDIAASIQKVTEEIVLRIVRTVAEETQHKNLCLAGGVALNCVANGRILREGPFEKLWIQPAAGDAGGAVGAALAVWHGLDGGKRCVNGYDRMSGSYLGPRFEAAEIEGTLDGFHAKYERLSDADLFDRVAALLDEENVIGWFQGRMEFGPRALGGRSIIGDARSSKMQTTMNLKIKYRESFRPFAPSVLAERVTEYFETVPESPYMLIVGPVLQNLRIALSEEEKKLFGVEKLKIKRSQLPAITHVDYSARVQTVHKETNPRYHSLLTAFYERTGCGVLVNTSFNVRGEPIVCTPEDAYRCFMRTEIDFLVVENYLLDKRAQPEWPKDDSWKTEFELD